MRCSLFVCKHTRRLLLAGKGEPGQPWACILNCCNVLPTWILFQRGATGYCKHRLKLVFLTCRCTECLPNNVFVAPNYTVGIVLCYGDSFPLVLFSLSQCCTNFFRLLKLNSYILVLLSVMSTMMLWSWSLPTLPMPVNTNGPWSRHYAGLMQGFIADLESRGGTPKFGIAWHAPPSR